MLIYLLKSSGCLLVLMLFYKLFLERESIHQFKRFYLLGSLIAAFLIPLVTWTTYVEIPAEPEGVPFDPTLLPMEDMPTEESFNWSLYLGVIYGSGVLFFGLRFIKNLWSLHLKIKRNQKIPRVAYIQVLILESIVPHTFLKYVFVEKSQFDSKNIPDEILLHEQIHVEQKHTLDILLIEVMQIFLWFHPLIYLIKKDIKLNHEFLADQAVLSHGFETKNYQNILLDYSISSSHNQLVSSINYSLIKKRLTVMKTHTSKQVKWLKSLVLLPLLALLIYSFSTNKIVETGLNYELSETNHTARSIKVEVLNQGTYQIDGINATKGTFASVLNQLHQDITPEIRNQIINVHVNDGKPVSDEDVWFIFNSFTPYGFHRIVTYNQQIIREKGNKPFAIVSQNDPKNLNSAPEKVELQEGASKAQIAEYNKLAKKYNSQPKEEQRFLKKEVERLEYLYGLMTKEQKAHAEPFPNIPPPPPPPPTPPVEMGSMSPELQKLYKHYTKETEAYSKAVSAYIKNNKGSQEDLKNQYTDVMKLYKAYYELASKEKLTPVPPPPPPPAPEAPEVIEVIEVPVDKLDANTPKSAYDFVRSHKNDDITYYYNDKKVTYNEILKIVKKEPNININTNINDHKGTVKFWSKK
ncbi:M56 family metallopeptidase [Mangrovimonas sp. ST2L15]|uniref:M56 family metallopeptidase n=1 Tax=Mangrovimonas sp. ST2L15 TaxID=1645916 RepID=UPI0009E75BE4|nr:M56 family metallopeptidase [Mangrovimonas sp. ST2L15]